MIRLICTYKRHSFDRVAFWWRQVNARVGKKNARVWRCGGVEMGQGDGDGEGRVAEWGGGGDEPGLVCRGAWNRVGGSNKVSKHGA